MLPAIRFTTVYVWTNQHSIATIIWALYKNEEFFLCFVIFMFSIFFPFLKLFYLLTLVTSPDMPAEFRDKSISTMEWLGRYSMTDVMVLALMIFYMNASGYTEASVLPGVYFFAASALMTMFAYGWANSVNPGVRPRQASLQARLASIAPADRRRPPRAGHPEPRSTSQRVRLSTESRQPYCRHFVLGAVRLAGAQNALRLRPPLSCGERTPCMSLRRSDCLASLLTASLSALLGACAMSGGDTPGVSLSDPALAAKPSHGWRSERDPGPACQARNARRAPQGCRRTSGAAEDRAPKEPAKTAAPKEPPKAAAPKEPAPRPSLAPSRARPHRASDTSACTEGGDCVAQLKRMVDGTNRTWVGRAEPPQAVRRRHAPVRLPRAASETQLPRVEPGAHRDRRLQQAAAGSGLGRQPRSRGTGCRARRRRGRRAHQTEHAGRCSSTSTSARTQAAGAEPARPQ